jgi:hypothetical protein
MELLGLNSTLDFLMVYCQAISNSISNARGRSKGFRGGSTHGGIAAAKDGLLVFVFFAVMVVVVLVLSGPTTGTSGIFGNVQIATQWRNAGFTLSQFAVVVGLLIIIVIIGALT